MFLPTTVSRAIHRADDILRRRGVWQLYRTLQESRSWPRERIDQLQTQKLRELLRHAEKHNPYYRDVMREAGLEPEDIRHPSDVRALPLLTREIIRDRAEEIRSRGIPVDRMTPFSTSGSTGSITRFWVDLECWRWRDAASFYMWEVMGARAGDSLVNVWACPIDKRWVDGPLNLVRRVLDNKRIVSAYALGDDDIEGILRYLGRARPKVLTGYASALDRIATQVRRRGLKWPGRPGLIVASQAEELYPEQRRNIAETLHARVFNIYGCREVGIIAVECDESGGMHLLEERHFVEFLPSETGEGHRIIITDLDSRGFPFIRYEIGDAAELDESPCPCGRVHRKFGRIHGRTLNVVRGPEGKAVAGNFFSFLLREAVEGVETWQVVQQQQDHVEIRVTPPHVLTQSDKEKIRAEVRRALGDGMRVEISEVVRLEPLASGKHRFVVALAGSDGPQ